MKYKPKKISVHDMIGKMVSQIKECDADEFCVYVELMFGVNAEYDSETEDIIITPNLDYCNAFGDFEEYEECIEK